MDKQTEYVLRTGQALLADREAIESLAHAGEVASFGSRSVYWLGVPLICDERTVGVVATLPALPGRVTTAAGLASAPPVETSSRSVEPAPVTKAA